MKIQTPEEALRHYFGYDSFRPLQREIIETVMRGRDCLVLMPTGGGKSICYQVPALIKPGICVVISPLIALMRDQVEALRANGISAAYLNSSLDFDTYMEVIEQVKIADLKLLYISPEKLLTPEIKDLLSSVKISMFAIDEAHCISAWGHDFRPEYTRLQLLKTRFRGVPIIALTATADKNTRRDILGQLSLSDPEIFISSFDRPNLSLTVIPGQNKTQKVLDFVKLRPQQPGIIYCLSRKGTESLAKKLQEKGLEARFYHAGVGGKIREKVQDDFLNDRIQIVCATVAFGMGIDKSNVRWVIHYNLPKNLESYYQEIGRAGRDGLPSDTLLLYSHGDVIQHRRFLEESGQQELQLAKLERMEQYASAQVCRRRILLSYFGEHEETPCGNCDICKNPPEWIDGTVLAQKALSALYRLRGEVGINTLVDVLRGSQKKEILERGYDQIKTYGAGSDMSHFDWQHCLLQMMHLGLLEINYDQNKTLKLTPGSMSVLKGEQKVEMVKPEKNFQKSGTTKKAPAPLANLWEEGLFEELRLFRYELAQKQGIPPYVVFSDSTLWEMVRHLPKDEGEMREISGVGAVKFRRYGEKFIDRIQSYVRKK